MHIDRPLKVMLDGNIHDKLIEDEQTLARIKALIEEGALICYSTHVQRDEMRRTPDEVKRAALLAISIIRPVPTAGVIWNTSRWNECMWADDETARTIDALQKGKTSEAEDALIGATAAKVADVLVTEDGNFSNRMRATAPHIQVDNYRKFVDRLAGIAAG